MPEDVIPADPSPAVAPADALPVSETVPAPVSAVPVERPVENLAAEMHRRMAKLQQQMDTLMQYTATQAQSHPAAATADPTDEELFSLMQQGDKRAFDLYVRRLAEQSGQTQVRALRAQQLVDSQLGILANRYPVLNDASHPLTQQVNATYSALVAQGYAGTRATLLEALKTAIADRPDIVAELQAKIAPAVLRRERAQSGITGATVREAPSVETPKPVTPAEAALARRMGIKDPAKSKERFYQRQARGESSLGAVASYVKEE